MNMKSKRNYWGYVQFLLENEFPHEYETYSSWEEEAEDAIKFLTGEGEKAKGKINLVEKAYSVGETVDYDDFPRGEEFSCRSILEIDGEFYSVELVYKSWGGYHFNNVAYKVQPVEKTIIVYQ